MLGADLSKQGVSDLLIRQRSATADLKLNELLFAALEAWEEKHGLIQ